MSDTLKAAKPVGRDTSTALNWEFYTQRARAKGARTADERRELTGLSRSTENRWRRGKNISLQKADAVAAVLDTSLDELTGKVSR